jgi:predicted MFS family arabinose efflux permease
LTLPVEINRDKKYVYALICFGCLTISFNVAAIAAAVPVISAGLGLSDLLVARIIPYYLIPYGLGALIYAPLTKYISYRWVYILTMSLYGLFCLICGFATDLDFLLVGRTGMGITASSAIPLGLMLIGEFFGKEVRGRLIGVFFSCAFIASIAGLVVMGIMNWPWIFHIPAFMASALAVVVLIYPSHLLNKKHVGHINYARALTQPEIAKVFAYIFIISFLYHGVHKWYGVYLSQVYGFDKLTISFMIILTVIGGMFGQLLGGVLTDKKGRLLTCAIGIVGLSVTICLLFGHYSKLVLGVILLLISVFWTVGHNGISTVLTDFSHEDRPIIASLNSSVRFIGGGIGFYVSSLFVVKSFSLTFLSIGICLIVLAGFLKCVVPDNC